MIALGILRHKTICNPFDSVCIVDHTVVMGSGFDGKLSKDSIREIAIVAIVFRNRQIQMVLGSATMLRVADSSDVADVWV